MDGYTVLAGILIFFLLFIYLTWFGVSIKIESQNNEDSNIKINPYDNLPFHRKLCAWFLLATAVGGLTFVGMQAFEWSKLIFHEGVRPWGNPYGAAQFGSFFFMITGFHGTHVSIGVIFLFIFARKTFRGDFDTDKRGFFTSMKSDYVAIEIMGLYWHFVDLVWVFIFAFFYLW